MAAPTAPTLISLTTEALKKAGHSSPTAAQLTRAQDEYMAEIKNDLLVLAGGRKLKALHTTAIMVTTDGQSRYTAPTDYFSDMTMQIMDGSTTGTAQTGAVGSITLAADDAQSEGQMLGTEILITGGTGKGSLSQCTAFNTSTKVATVTPDFTIAPDSTSTYMRVDRYYPVKQKPFYDLARTEYTQTSDRPQEYYPMGDADYSEFIMHPAPYRSSGVPWGVKLTYYADLMTLDLPGTLMATLYRRWRNLWVQGVRAKQLESNDSKRAKDAKAEYRGLLRDLVREETYGSDLTNLQCTIGDY